MNKVTTINLNGRAYQLEERGFEILRKYLDTAGAKLADNPDKDEIMADFEQAIADKFDQKLNGHKNVISEREVEDIIAAMGPVDTQDATAAPGNTGAPKRFYRLPFGEWIAGVCSGLAAYFNVDVTLIRIIFILLTLITHGLMIIAYIVLWVVMPVAHTKEEHAQAHGWTSRPPFNAHDFIEEAKKRYAEWHDELQKMHDEHKAAMAVAGTKEDWHKWKHEFRDEMRQKKQQMKQEWRAHQREWRNDWRDERRGGHGFGVYCPNVYGCPNYGPGYGISRAIFGFFAVIVSIVLLAAGVAWALSLYTLIKYGTVFGYAIGIGHPLWLSIVFLCVAFYIIVAPFRLMLHQAWGNAHHESGWREFIRTLVFFIVLGILIWTARELFPQVNTAWETSMAWLRARI